TKFLKWGYGKVTDHACREIRLKRMTREEGIDRVKQYESVIPKDLPLFLSWMNMSAPEFYDCVNRFRDPSIWMRRTAGDFDLLDSVSNHRGDEGVDAVRLSTNGDPEFRITP